MKLVLVASTNPCKVDACKQAFTKVFREETFRFEAIRSVSGVSDQPFGEEETRQGAINRVLYAHGEWMKSHKEQPDFVVGLEGGVKEDEIPINEKERRKSLMLFAWMAILAPSENRWGFGRSGSFYLPPAIVKLVESGMELGDADDQFFHKVKSGQSTGTVGILTDELISRGAYYDHALVLSLIPFLHPELYPME